MPDLVDLASARPHAADALLRDEAAPALSLALVGLCLWLPAWLLVQREHERTPIEAAAATTRRVYLLLVSGLALAASMISLAYLVYEALGLLLDAGHAVDAAWAVGTFVVATLVLARHLLALRSDMRLVAASGLAPGFAHQTDDEQTPGVPPKDDLRPGAEVETIELRGPSGTDFEVLNADIRSRLPEGFELRVVPAQRPSG